MHDKLAAAEKSCEISVVLLMTYGLLTSCWHMISLCIREGEKEKFSTTADAKIKFQLQLALIHSLQHLNNVCQPRRLVTITNVLC